MKESKVMIMSCNKTVYYGKKSDILMWAIKWPFRTALFILWLPFFFALIFWNGLKGFWRSVCIFANKEDLPSGFFLPFIVLWQMIVYRKKRVKRYGR